MFTKKRVLDTQRLFEQTQLIAWAVIHGSFWGCSCCDMTCRSHPHGQQGQ